MNTRDDTYLPSDLVTMRIEADAEAKRIDAALAIISIPVTNAINNNVSPELRGAADKYLRVTLQTAAE